MSARLSLRLLCTAFAAVLGSCDASLMARGDAELGGTAGMLGIAVGDATRDAFGLPIANLTEPHRAAFFVGNSFFNQNWVSAPASVQERDGLGPLFNARSCSTCHFRDGRGRPPGPGEELRGMLLRIGVPGRGPHGAPLPDPTYGDQLQTQALGDLPREARVGVEYAALGGTYADGERYTLRVPSYQLQEPGFGPFSEQLLLSPRVAPATIGMGLLEAIPEATLVRLADPDDRDGDGISGRPNRVTDVERGTVSIGRFGWKAEQPSLRAQVAAAFVGDMGITTRLFPEENHTRAQALCDSAASGGEPEASAGTLDKVTHYMRTLAVPAQREPGDPGIWRGWLLFQAAGCAACHVPSMRTGDVADLPELSQQTFRPFTDLLLHDLGEGLSDQRPSFAASGREWRTAPLWGIGLLAKVNGHTFLLHDGRARGVAEAILWHAGEAELAKQRFVRLLRAQRLDLVRFVESL